MWADWDSITDVRNHPILFLVRGVGILGYYFLFLQFSLSNCSRSVVLSFLVFAPNSLRIAGVGQCLQTKLAMRDETSISKALSRWNLSV